MTQCDASSPLLPLVFASLYRSAPTCSRARSGCRAADRFQCSGCARADVSQPEVDSPNHPLIPACRKVVRCGSGSRARHAMPWASGTSFGRGRQADDGFPQRRQSIALHSTLGFLRDGHFNQAHADRYLLVLLAEMLFIAELQRHHQFGPAHLALKDGQQSCNFGGDFRGDFGGQSKQNRTTDHHTELIGSDVINQFDGGPILQGAWNAGAQPAIRQDVYGVLGERRVAAIGAACK